LHRSKSDDPGNPATWTAGQGGPQHLAGEYFQKLAGIRPNHLPYEGEKAYAQSASSKMAGSC